MRSGVQGPRSGALQSAGAGRGGRARSVRQQGRPAGRPCPPASPAQACISSGCPTPHPPRLRRSKPWSARQLRVLDQINGAETVMEAVSRVNKLVTLPTPEAAEVTAALDLAAPAPALAPPAAAAPGGPRSAGRQQQQQQQRLQRGQPEQQLSPRTFAQSLSCGFAPTLLPPPPGARGGKPAASAAPAAGATSKSEPPAWEAFASAELQTREWGGRHWACAGAELNSLA